MKQKLTIIISILSLTFGLGSNANCQWVKTNGPVKGTIWCLGVNDTDLLAGCGNGIFLTHDNGVNWKGVDTTNDVHENYIRQVNAFAVDGKNILAGTSSGIYLSSDNGSSWERNIDTNLTFDCSVIIGTNILGGSSGIIVSSDSGRSWKKKVGTPSDMQGVIALTSKDTTLFAGTNTGVFRSIDKGESWEPINKGFTDSNVHALAVIGKNIFAGTWGGSGVFISTDNGTNWRQAITGLPSDPAVNIYALAVSGSNLFAGTDSNVFLSTDNGSHWEAVNTGLSNRFDNRVISLAVMGANLFAGTVGDGVWRRPLPEMISITSVEPVSKKLQNAASFPNPFSQSTTIKFTFDKPGFAQVSVHNLLGAEVARLYSGELEGGEHSFAWDGRGMSAGMYICIVRSGGNTQELPMMLVK